MIDFFEKLAKSNSIMRKVSPEKTDECPIYDPDMDHWVESDEDLKNRIKARLSEAK